MTRYFLTNSLVVLLFVLMGAEASAKAPKGRRHAFSVQGTGNFFPANLGKTGAPGAGLIVGDGVSPSSYGLFNAPPIGSDFRLNGRKVGSGADTHFGAAESLDSGIQRGQVVIYRMKTARNPLANNRRIHIMKSDEGEVWFNYTGFFALNQAAGTLNGRWDFRIVGGTGRFANARGKVLVTTKTDTANIAPLQTPRASGLNAPFEYKFIGFIDIR